jgi:hypothetical protein
VQARDRDDRGGYEIDIAGGHWIATNGGHRSRGLHTVVNFLSLMMYLAKNPALTEELRADSIKLMRNAEQMMRRLHLFRGQGLRGNSVPAGPLGEIQSRIRRGQEHSGIVRDEALGISDTDADRDDATLDG